MKFRLDKFDPESIKPHRSLLVVGRSGVGKSTVALDLLRNLAPRYDYGIFFCPTANEFRKIAPSCFVYETSLDLAVLTKIMEIQKSILSEGKSRSVLLVTDDCASEKSVFASTAVRSLLMNGRHLHIQWMNIVQYVYSIPPDARSQIGYWICCNETNHGNLKRLHAGAFGVVEKYSEFKLIFQQLTVDHKVAILDCTDGGGELSQQLYWYKAELKQPKFTIGRQVYWKLEREHRNKKSKTALSIVGVPAQRREVMDAI
jgi:GTPase SAR1 family protein|eukprot:1744987-Prymnesium_polylepis.3